jgi:hypothetical protein
MRKRISCSKPFITDSDAKRKETAITMPTIDNFDKNADNPGPSPNDCRYAIS